MKDIIFESGQTFKEVTPSTDSHIDNFYLDTGNILVSLYHSFPKRVTLLAADLLKEGKVDQDNSDRAQSCLGAMLWLADAGYIRYEKSSREDGLDESVLTHKAFTLLSSKATFNNKEYSADKEWLSNLLEDYQTNVTQLRELLKSGTTQDVRQLVQFLMIQSANY